MSGKKILWLCSWYPNRVDPFDGDFIQRHAKAAALYNDIYVIRVVPDDKGNITDSVKNEIQKREGLTEQIIYFKKSPSWLGKAIAINKWLRLYKKAIKQYIHENGKPDLVHVHVPIKAGILALWMKHEFGIPIVVTEHLGIYNDIIPGKFAEQRSWFKMYTRKIFSNASAFYSVSRFLGDGVNRLVMRKDYKVIPNTVDTTHFFYKPSLSSKFRFIHVSNMVPLKNVEGILVAAERMNNVEWVIVGPYHGNTQRGENIFFTGEIPYEKVAAEMQAANALILFSDIENSPCVIGEAHCCGLPVIATNTGGIPELINPSNGILVEPGNIDQLAAAMKKMIEEYNSYDRSAIANEATNKYSYSTIGKLFNEEYSRLPAPGS